MQKSDPMRRPDRLLVAGLAQGGGEPLKTLVQTITGSSASRLDVLSGMLAQAVGQTWKSSICDLPMPVVAGCGDRACR